jgi:hypothetical protein
LLRCNEGKYETGRLDFKPASEGKGGIFDNKIHAAKELKTIDAG